MNTLQALGWNWRTDGVEVCAQIDGRRYCLFVPLNRVWHEFAKAFAESGIPLPPQVGAHLTVSGLFESIAQAQAQPAVGWFGSSIAHAVSKAASGVVKAAVAPVATVLKPVATAVQAGTRALSSVPVFGGALSAATTALTSPVMAVNGLVSGGKISSVAMNALKSNISSMRTLAPYVQTVISVVPGVGQGLSGAIGAGLALASGMSINDAVMAGVRDSLPGGPLARAAFDLAAAAAQGKPIANAALSALASQAGLSPAALNGVVHSVQLARDLAQGKNVSHALMDAGIAQLPPDLRKATQIALALSHAKSLQQAVGVAANASNVASTIRNGLNASNLLRALPTNVQPPPHLIQAVRSAQVAQHGVQQAVNLAAQGHAPASQWLAFLSKPHIAGPLPKNFTARFHSNTTSHHHKRSGGIHHRHASHVGAPLKTFTARFHTDPSPTVSGIGARFVSGPFRRPFSYPPRPVAQLYPVRMPYQTASHLHSAWGR